MITRPNPFALMAALPEWLKHFGLVLIESIKAWIDHRGASKGAALAFYTLFSLTPILVLAIAVAGYFFGEDAARGEIMAQIQGLTGPNAAQAIQALLAASRDPASGKLATLIASGLLLLAATTVFAELKASLDELWGIEESTQSALAELIRTRLLSVGLILVLALLLMASLLVNGALAVLEAYAVKLFAGSTAVLAMLSSGVSFCIIVTLFAAIYKTLPEAPLSWGDVWIGAVFTACLFSLGKSAIGLYLGKSGVESSFGAAGSLIAMLLWVYYSAQIFFLGAEFTRQYALRFGSLQAQGKRLESPSNTV